VIGPDRGELPGREAVRHGASPRVMVTLIAIALLYTGASELAKARVYRRLA
jgi:hypothetical protein